MFSFLTFGVWVCHSISFSKICNLFLRLAEAWIIRTNAVHSGSCCTYLIWSSMDWDCHFLHCQNASTVYQSIYFLHNSDGRNSKWKRIKNIRNLFLTIQPMPDDTFSATPQRSPMFISHIFSRSIHPTVPLVQVSASAVSLLPSPQLHSSSNTNA